MEGKRWGGKGEAVKGREEDASVPSLAPGLLET